MDCRPGNDSAALVCSQGIAIPHCRADIPEPIVHLFAFYPLPVDFDALDGQDVDFFCVLLVPTDNEVHLNLLREVIQIFRRPRVS